MSDFAAVSLPDGLNRELRVSEVEACEVPEAILNLGVYVYYSFYAI